MLFMGAFFYPCQVVSTNRILRSSVVAQESSGYVTLFQHLRNIYDSGTLWRGFFPYVSSLCAKILPLRLAYGAAKTDDIIGSAIVTGFGTFLANPLELVTTRHQNVDFKKQTLVEDLKAMACKDEAAIFRTGLKHALARNLILMFFITQRMETPDSILSAVTLGTVFSHPFQVLRSRQMWASTGGEAQKLAVGEDIMKALKQVRKEEGYQGLFRGLAPRLLFYVCVGYALFVKEERHRRGQQ